MLRQEFYYFFMKKNEKSETYQPNTLTAFARKRQIKALNIMIHLL